MTSEEYKKYKYKKYKKEDKSHSTEVDLQKRKILKLLFGIVYPFGGISYRNEENSSQSRGEKEHSFVSFILGKKLSSEDFENMMNILRKLRRNFTSFPLELFLRISRFLPKNFFESLYQSKKIGRIKKSFFILLKAGFMFPYYSLDKNWERIGYTGPFVGKSGFSRYSDPDVKLFTVKDDEVSADLCVIGSGAGGAISAFELSEKFSVIMIEKGDFLKPDHFNEREDDMIPKLYDISFDENFSVLVLKGKTLGGSTIHNTALFVKLPEHVFDFWCEKGFPIPWSDFSVLQDKVFALCGAEKIEEDKLNRNAELSKKGMEKLGLKHFIPHHARRDCLGVGFCELGCHWNRKFSTLLYFIPEFERKGGKVITGAQALYFKKLGKRVSYLVCKTKDGRKFRVKAKYFILSTGALSSPIIIRNSFDEIPKSYSLCLHPSTYVMGVFDEPVFGWLGIPISLISDEFLKPDRGFILMPYFAHPGVFSVALGGFGFEHRKIMLEYRNIAMLSILPHDESGGGVLRDGFISLRYIFTKNTVYDVKMGIEKSAEVLFEAGAKKVILPDIFKLISAKNMKDVRAYLDFFDVSRVPFLSVHPQATLRWQDYLDEEGRVKGIENLWVADASVFPASCGVPPQVSVMATSLFVAERIKERT